MVEIISSLLGSPWIPLAALIALAACGRILYGTWLHPGAFPALVWSVFILSVFTVAPDYEVSGLAVWSILVLILAGYIGTALAEGQLSYRGEPAKVKQVSLKRLLFCVLFFSSVAMAGSVLFGIKSLSEYGLPMSPQGLVALGHLASVDRYSGAQEPLIVRALWTWVFPAAVLGGVTFVIADDRLQKCLSVAAVVPALTLSFLETTRASLVVPICCWLGGFMATKVMLTAGKYQLFSRRSLLVAGVLVLLVVFVFVALDALRVFTPENDFAVEGDFSRFKGYAFGSLSYFSNWMDREESSSPITFGGQTFRSFVEFVGLQDRQIGVELAFNDGGRTNISTAIRGLIQDFTFPGAFLVCLAVGYAGGRAFDKTRQGDLAAEPVLAAFYTLFIFSPVISLTAYNGPIVGWIVATFVLRSAAREGRIPSVSTPAVTD
jgi:oligosaccharide repeat unit polymerase